MPMVVVKCTSCNGDIELDDQNETGFCLYCGTKVIFREAVQKIELINGPKVENFIKIAKVAYEDGNYDEAIGYFNKALEVDSDNSEAIYYKGLSRAWKSTLANVLLFDVVSASERALELETSAVKLSEEEIEKLKNRFAKDINGVTEAFFQLANNHYNQYYDLKDSVFDYWINLEHCTTLTTYCLNLITDSMAENNDEFKQNKIRFLKQQILYKVEQCKWCVVKNGETSLNLWFPNESREAAVEIYDKCVEQIQRDDPSYVPPEITRVGQKGENGVSVRGGCYIATAVYGSYQAPEVMVLRRFRDEVCSKNLLGRAFIKTYYAISPPFANWLKGKKRINSIVKLLLDNIVNRLEN